MADGTSCADDVHYFDTAEGIELSRDQACLCGEVTWGEMDDLLTLTRMWQTVSRG